MIKNKILNLCLLLLLCGCSKSEFLDKKPRTSLLVPTTIADFEKLLDNIDMNVSGVLGEVSSDDYYLPTKQIWEAVPFIEERNAYVWKPELFEGLENVDDWNSPYQQILYANIVLEGLTRLDSTKVDALAYKKIKGRAYFHRGFAYFNLAQHFCAPYQENTALASLGLILRSESDVTVVAKRANLKDTYEQFIDDIKKAEQLLPDVPPGNDRNRPYKSSASALLARVFLAMRRYDDALSSANNALKMYDKLIDYNTISVTATLPFSPLNIETLFSCNLHRYGSLAISTYRSTPNALVDSSLYASYDNNDLRKVIFFNISTVHQRPTYKGSYTGRARKFSGLAIDELYLIKAECEVRQGEYHAGMNTLNRLLITRFKPNTYVPYQLTDIAESLRVVLLERRKELVFRGLRWQDLRRLNVEGANITLKRVLDNKTYLLLPNSTLYVLPIPSNEIRLSNIPQNNR